MLATRPLPDHSLPATNPFPSPIPFTLVPLFGGGITSSQRSHLQAFPVRGCPATIGGFLVAGTCVLLTTVSQASSQELSHTDIGWGNNSRKQPLWPGCQPGSHGWPLAQYHVPCAGALHRHSEQEEAGELGIRSPGLGTQESSAHPA